MSEASLVANAALSAHLGHVLRPGSRDVEAAIHAADEMYTYPIVVLGRSAEDSVVEYFQVGSATFSVLTQVLTWLGKSWANVGRVLDFASGFGRVSRFVAAAGCAELVVSDIVAPAVAFQREALGIGGFVSGPRPERVDLQGPYGFVSVISLFSHLPESTFAAWLTRLTNALAPGGAMLFTTHGEAAYARSTDRPLLPTDFVFHRASESDRIAKTEYGNTFVHPARVRALIAAIPGIDLLAFVPHGLNEHQDVFVIGRNVAAPREPLRFRPVPRVFVDEARRSDVGSLHASGWAIADGGNEPVRTVTVSGEHGLSIVAETGGARPDLVAAFRTERAANGGWTANGPLPVSAPRWLTAVAEDARGLRGFCYRPFPS